MWCYHRLGERHGTDAFPLGVLKSSPTDTWFQNFSLPNWENKRLMCILINVCYLNYPVGGTGLWQSLETNTFIKCLTYLLWHHGGLSRALQLLSGKIKWCSLWIWLEWLYQPNNLPFSFPSVWSLGGLRLWWEPTPKTQSKFSAREFCQPHQPCSKVQELPHSFSSVESPQSSTKLQLCSGL